MARTAAGRLAALQRHLADSSNEEEGAEAVQRQDTKAAEVRPPPGESMPVSKGMLAL